MARNRTHKPKTSTQLALSTGSAVAVASFQRSGAGKHGGSDRQRNRNDRHATRRELRGGW
jgi:hypothetical protein